MLGLLNRYGRLLVLPAAAAVFFLGALFFFYRGTYDAPPSFEIPVQSYQPPLSTFTTLAESPPIHHGTLLVDAGHDNDYTQQEMTAFFSRISQRGYDIELLGRFGSFGNPITLATSDRLDFLRDKLRGADSFLVIQPSTAYSGEEVAEIQRFVLEKGGKLMLVADPTRDHRINTLADGFGITFRPDYLYNQVDYDLNFQDIFIREFGTDELTSGLGTIALYTAGSLESSGPWLAISDAGTQSTLVKNFSPLYPMVKSSDGGVVAIGDMTFMVPPQDGIYDNGKLISNLANFMTKSQRQFHLADFPHFFGDDLEIILSGSALVDAAAQMKRLLDDLQVASQIRGVESLNRDSVYLGLYDDAVNVTQYLQLAGVQIEDTIRTPFAPDIAPGDTAIVILHQSSGRQVLVILADTPESLSGMLDLLSSGDFRDGLLGDFVGVYKTS
jgi:hypothetical protein